MSNTPPSLGDEPAKKKYRRVEQHIDTNPSWTRSDRVKLFESILAKGHVQMVHFEVGQPVVYAQLVEDSGEDVPMPEELPEDLFVVSRNYEMKDLVIAENWQGATCLLHALRTLDGMGLRPLRLFIHEYAPVLRWLCLDPGQKPLQVLGIPVESRVEMPNDAVLLVATGYTETGAETYFSMRIGMNIPKEVADVIEQPPRRAPDHGSPPEDLPREDPGVGSRRQVGSPAPGGVGVPAAGQRGQGAKRGGAQVPNPGAGPQGGRRNR